MVENIFWKPQKGLRGSYYEHKFKWFVARSMKTLAKLNLAEILSTPVYQDFLPSNSSSPSNKR